MWSSRDADRIDDFRLDFVYARTLDRLGPGDRSIWLLTRCGLPQHDRECRALEDICLLICRLTHRILVFAVLSPRRLSSIRRFCFGLDNVHPLNGWRGVSSLHYTTA